MATITRKQVCSCTNCGNEAEMVVTCNLPEVETKTNTDQTATGDDKQVRGSATCSHCGNEADMWIEL